MAIYADDYIYRCGGGSPCTSAPKNWTLAGSNDGSNWTTLDTQTNITGWTDGEAKTFSIASPSSYRYYRITITANNGEAVGTSCRDLSLRSGGVRQNTFMTSNTAPSPYVTSASSVYSTYYAYKAFDNDSASGWFCNGATGWLQYDSATPPTPVISSLTPDHGAIGASVTIAGTYFGSSQGASTITFNGTAVTSISSWSETSITCTVPAGATTGNVVVTVLGAASAGTAFTVHPYISSLTPDSGEVTDHFTIAGVNFGAAKGASTVHLNAVECSTVNWSNTSIEAVVPAGATDGNVVVTVGGNASNGVAFDVLPNDPVADSLTPDEGVVGDTITIAGSNFGAVQGASTVKFGATVASINSWSSTEIVCEVPLINNDCNVTVTQGGVPSNGVAFTLNPELISMSPNSGRIGDEITLAGTGFKIAAGKVYFGTEEAGIETWSNVEIVCTVPAITNDCNVKVTSNA